MVKNTLPFLLLTAVLSLASLTPANAQFGFGAATKAPETAVTSVDSIQPGVPFFAGIRLDITPGWHTYWENAGNDIGLYPSLYEGPHSADMRPTARDTAA